MCIVDNVRLRFKKFEFSNGRYPVQEESIDQIFWGDTPLVMKEVYLGIPQ